MATAAAYQWMEWHSRRHHIRPRLHSRPSRVRQPVRPLGPPIHDAHLAGSSSVRWIASVLRSGWATVQDLDTASEDCLFINIVVPPNATSAPVLVYIHAGEFHYGAASDRESDLAFFAPEAVFVTFNFRLGVFGYLASEDLRWREASGGTGNYGIHDQRQALRWVQEHIGAFGGDKAKVTIMGESSGGSSVGYHLTSPASYGLFARTILESPGLTQVKSLPDAELNYQYVLAALAAIGSSGCERAPDGAYAAFPSVIHTGTVLGFAADRAAAEAACDEDARCAGYTHYPNTTEAQFVLSAITQPVVTRAIGIDGHSYSRMVNHSVYGRMRDQRSNGGCASCVAYLKAAAGGATGVRCLELANATTLVSLTEYVPRDDDFATDGWAPVVDGVDLVAPILDSIASGSIAPGVDALIGSNMDEGTIFMCAHPSHFPWPLSLPLAAMWLRTLPHHCPAAATCLAPFSLPVVAMWPRTLPHHLPAAATCLLPHHLIWCHAWQVPHAAPRLPRQRE